ncbi:MAG: CoA-binding protein [bacterium]|nr:CoA-binding protein [bacterium]
MKEAVDEFLAQKRIAVAGVSRKSGEAANIVYKKLRGSGYQVFPVNPNADQVEGDPCYPDLASIPEGVDAVVVATPPQAGEQIVRECAELGISRVWMHRSFGQGSVSDDAVELCREKKISVIAGGCPMMFCEPVDLAHKCLRWILKVSGGLPEAESCG